MARRIEILSPHVARTDSGHDQAGQFIQIIAAAALSSLFPRRTPLIGAKEQVLADPLGSRSRREIGINMISGRE